MYGGRIGFITIGLKPSWTVTNEDLEALKNEINNKLEGMNRSSISNCNHFYQTITECIFKDNGMDEIIEIRDKVKDMLKLRYEKINSEIKKIKKNRKILNLDTHAAAFNALQINSNFYFEFMFNEGALNYSGGTRAEIDLIEEVIKQIKDMFPSSVDVTYKNKGQKYWFDVSLIV